MILCVRRHAKGHNAQILCTGRDANQREHTYQFPMAKSSNCTCICVCGMPGLEYYSGVIMAPNVIQHDYYPLD